MKMLADPLSVICMDCLMTFQVREPRIDANTIAKAAPTAPAGCAYMGGLCE